MPEFSQMGRGGRLRWVVEDSGCWEWQGAKSKKGYGLTRFDGKAMNAHRATWQAKHGPLPEGAVVHHTCHNPGCVNPEHLEVKENRTLHHREHVTLTPEQVRDIRARAIKGEGGNGTSGNLAELAEEYGVSISTVQKVSMRRRYAWVD